MWIFSTDGFCSAVADYDQPGNLLVRARLESDLEQMFPAARGHVLEHNDIQHDYRFRVSLEADYVKHRMIEMINEIDYFNFKDACANDRHMPYLRVWSAMHNEQLARAPAPVKALHSVAKAKKVKKPKKDA